MMDKPITKLSQGLEGKPTGNHRIKSTFLEKTQSLVSGFCYVRNRICDTMFDICFMIGTHSLLLGEMSGIGERESTGVVSCQYEQNGLVVHPFSSELEQGSSICYSVSTVN